MTQTRTYEETNHTGGRRSSPAPLPPRQAPGLFSWMRTDHPVRNALVLVVLMVVGGVAGAVVGDRGTETHVSEVRLAVGSESFASQSIPGYTEASKTLASNYARYVVDTSAGVAQLAARLDVPAREIRLIQASPITDSNIIRIEVTATSPVVGRRAAGVLAAALTRQVNAPPAEVPQLRAALLASARQVAVFEARLGDLSRRARTARAENRIQETRRLSGLQVKAKTGMSLAEAQQQSVADQYKSSLQIGTSEVSLRTVREPTTVSDSRAASVQGSAIVGVAAGVLVALLVLLLLFVRSRARARTAR